MFRLIELFLLKSVNKYELKEQINELSFNISKVVKEHYPFTLSLKSTLEKFKDNTLPLSLICKIIVIDCLLSYGYSYAVYFISKLTCRYLKNGICNFFAKFTFKHYKFTIEDAMAMTDSTLRDFYLLNLAQTHYLPELHPLKHEYLSKIENKEIKISI